MTNEIPMRRFSHQPKMNIWVFHQTIKKQNFILMKQNMGTIDKVIRILVAVVVAILYFTKVVDGTLGIVLLIFAGVFVLTSLIGVCPLYYPIGLNTGKKK